MARRRVSVELELDAAKYTASAKSAEATTKAVKDKVQDLDKAALLAEKGVAKLGDKTKHAAGDMVLLKSEIKRVEAELRTLARDYEKTGDAAVLSAFKQKQAELNRMNSVQKTIEKLNASAKDDKPAQSLTTLRNEIQKVENELKKLAAEYQHTGSVATATSLRQRNSVLNDLRALEAEAQKAMNLAAGATSSASSIGDGIGLKPILIGALVAVGVAAAPAIGAIIGAAVLGAVGTGGIVGGIIAATKDPGVRAAASSFGQSVSKDFFASGDAFVAPVQRSLGMLAKTFHDLDLKDSFAIAAPYVERVANGIDGLARQFMPGFNTALKAAGPVLDEFARDLPMIGASLSDFFTDISNGKGNVEGMRLLMSFLDATIQGLGKTIQYLSDQYEQFIRIGIKVSDVLADLPLVGRVFNAQRDAFHAAQDPAERIVAVYQKMGDSAQSMVNPNLAAAQSVAGVGKAYGDMQPMAKSVEDTTAGLQAATAAYVRHLDEQAKAVDTNKRAFSDLMQTQSDYLQQILGSKHAMLAWKQDWLDLAASVKAHGKSLNTNTADGLANAQALLTLAADAQRVRDEMLKNPATAAKANAAYLSMMKKLEDFAVRLGISRKAAHDLLWQLEQFPGTISVGIDITTGGESHAADKSHGKSKPPPKKKKPPPDDKVPPRASGGDVLPGRPYRINEQGYETVTFPAAGTVHPANLVPWNAAGTTTTGGGGNRTITIVVKDTSGRTLVRELIDDARGKGIPEAVIRAAYPQ